MPESRWNRGAGRTSSPNSGRGARKTPQQETLTGPRRGGCGLLGRMQLTAPRALLSSGTLGRGFPWCRFVWRKPCDQISTRPLPVPPSPLPRFPAVLADVTAGTPATHGGGQQTELDARGCPPTAPGPRAPTRITPGRLGIPTRSGLVAPCPGSRSGSAAARPTGPASTPRTTRSPTPTRCTPARSSGSPARTGPPRRTRPAQPALIRGLRRRTR